jgi:hypothetical protein
MEGQASDGADPRTPRELIERTEQRWRAWVDAVEGIPEERLGEASVGHWSIKDLLGHVAFWEDWVIGHGKRILAGEPEPHLDEVGTNEGQVRERRDASVAEQKRYREDAHARLMAFLGTIRDEEPKFSELVKALEWETYKHYDDHAAQVRDWRSREVEKSRSREEGPQDG